MKVSVTKIVSVILISYLTKTFLQTLKKYQKVTELHKYFPVPLDYKNWKVFLFGFLPELLKNKDKLLHFRAELFEKASQNEKNHVLTVQHMSPSWNSGSEFNMVLSTRDPKMVKFILKDDFDTFVKSVLLRKGLKELLGKGIFRVNHGPMFPQESEEWGMQRKTASRIFTRNTFTGYVYDTFIQHTDKVIKIINDKIDETKSDCGIVEVKKLIYCFTMDSIGRIGFGVDLNTLEEKNVVPFSKAFDDVTLAMGTRQLRPGWELPFIGRVLYKEEKIIEDSVKILNDFSYSVIDERTKQKDIASRGDILSMFINGNPNISKEMLRDVVMSFMIAGRDTTACTLSFTLFLLASHPEIQERLFKELHEYFDADLTKRPNLEILKGFPYLDGIIFEALRLFPPVPVDGKQAARDTVLENGVKLPQGAAVVYEVFCMGRDENVYPEAGSFKPDRWINSDRPIESFDQYSFPVFQAGPRICLGKDLALYEVKILLIDLVRRFRFELPADLIPKDKEAFKKDVAMIDGRALYQLNITMSFKGPLNLKAHRRR